MKSPLSSWILICLSFIFFLNITMSDNDPHHRKHEVGQSNRISCSVQSNQDFRELSFYKGQAIIFKLWISTGNLSNELEVSGTFDDFTWTRNRTDQCINGISKGPPTLGCSRPNSDASKIKLLNGSEEMASLLIDSNYKSRIQVSGTIRNSTIKLTGLTKEDEGCYACKWKEFNVPELTEQIETCAFVEQPPGLSAGAIAGIVIGVLAGVALAGLLIWLFKKCK